MTDQEKTKIVDIILCSLPIYGVHTLRLEANYRDEDFFFEECTDSNIQKMSVVLPDEVVEAAEKLVNFLIQENTHFSDELSDSSGLLTAAISVTENYALKFALNYTVDGESEGSSFNEEELPIELTEKLTLTGATQFNISYGGSGDHGGRESYYFFKNGKDFIPADESTTRVLVDMLENYVFELSNPDFNNNGSRGSASFTLKDGIWTVEGEHSDYETFDKGEDCILYSSMSVHEDNVGCVTLSTHPH